MSHDNELIYIAMRGGLGNQLFQWQAAKLLQFFTELNIEFIPQQRNLAHNDAGIRAFEFPDISISKAGSRTLDLWVKKLLNKPDFGLSVKTSVAEQSTFFKESDDSDFINFCKEQRKSDGPFVLDGYFQSVRINHYLRSNGVILDLPGLRYESQEYKELKTVIYSGELTAVHIRRGDFSKYQSTIGVLSEDYYLQAASRLGLQRSSRILLFTDDKHETVSNEFSRFFHQFRDVTFASKLNSSAEILMAMSKCSSIITANSTLSWWAGYFSKHNNIITPYPFFRDLPNRFDLQLPSSKNEIAQWI